MLHLIQNETVLSFQAASDAVPGKPHVSTLHRWANEGLGGVRLEAFKLGGRRFTTLEALHRFFEKTNPGPRPVPPPSRRTARELDRQAADHRVSRRLRISAESASGAGPVSTSRGIDGPSGAALPLAVRDRATRRDERGW